MPNEAYVLDGDSSQLFINADAKGLDRLISTLTSIRQKLDENILQHDHLMSAVWGGTDLTQRSAGEGSRTVHHVKICGWTPEWVHKNGLID